MRKIAAIISLWNRTRKYNYFKSKVGFTSTTTILDVGFMNNDVNYEAANYLEKHYPFPQNITALGIDGKDVFCRNHPLIRAVLYDGRTFPFEDKSFDIGWSNAVIEHVTGGGEASFSERDVTLMPGHLFQYTQQVVSGRTAYRLSFPALASRENI